MDISFETAWHRCLQDVELARHSDNINRVFRTGPPAWNPLLGELVPALLFLRIVSLLDEGLTQVIDASASALPGRAPSTLQRRIQTLVAAGKLSAADELHSLRTQRNMVAHERRHAVTWEMVDAAISVVHSALRELDLVSDRPQYHFYATRGAAENSKESGVFLEQHCHYGLTEGERKVVEVAWMNKFSYEREISE